MSSFQPYLMFLLFCILLASLQTSYYIICIDAACNDHFKYIIIDDWLIDDIGKNVQLIVFILCLRHRIVEGIHYTSPRLFGKEFAKEPGGQWLPWQQ